MSIQLPSPIDLYFGATGAARVSVVDTCFASDGVVRDEGGSYEAIPAIRAWREDTLAKYDFTAEPLSVSTGEGKTTVRCRVKGNFPGSPIELNHIFELSEGRIKSLEIRS